jgi:hypothetical protein
LRFDIAANRLLFQQKDGTALKIDQPFAGFTLNGVDPQVTDLNPVVFGKGYPSTAMQNEETIYQVIAEGKTNY